MDDNLAIAAICPKGDVTGTVATDVLAGTGKISHANRQIPSGEFQSDRRPRCGIVRRGMDRGPGVAVAFDIDT
jgi:hypothetical protein